MEARCSGVRLAGMKPGTVDSACQYLDEPSTEAEFVGANRPADTSAFTCLIV